MEKNCVIIFDEAQMLPNDYLKPCIAMIEELLNNYKTSVVLCTATQPALKSFFQSDGIYAEYRCRIYRCSGISGGCLSSVDDFYAVEK